ncbi:MAG: DUF255 domain-containing protein [Gemmatimonadales bacterium]
MSQSGAEESDSGADGSAPQANRLIGEKSPYLLQHAYNPVDWYPWGDEAFGAAARDDKPIFLSIGYSTCHWCHVMERESFEDPEVASLLNDGFVPVKVDREERPDVDTVYMTVAQMMTGHGGWPLTVVMTPSKDPFFAGTYFPKQSRHGRIGLLDLLPRLSELWRERRSEALNSAGQIATALWQSAHGEVPGASDQPPGATDELGRPALDEAFRQLSRVFDPLQGGFGRAPKFPTPHNLRFLLRYWRRTGEPKALEMVEQTLRAMRQGAVYDQAGFGFHRYSTDARWMVPPEMSEVRSTRPRTRTAKAARESSTSGRTRSSARCWTRKTPGLSGASSTSTDAGTSRRRRPGSEPARTCCTRAVPGSTWRGLSGSRRRSSRTAGAGYGSDSSPLGSAESGPKKTTRSWRTGTA